MNVKTAPIPWFRVVVVLFLFLLTWYFLQVTAVVTPVPIKRSLSSFPRQLNGYHLSHSSQSSDAVVKLLGVNDYIDFTYQGPPGGSIGLYVAYYESVGVEGGYHSPRNCLPGGGWEIERISQVTLPVGIEGSKTSRVSEMVIKNGDERQLVLYWFQNRGRVIGSEYWEKIYLVWDAMVKRRRDGSFVRIITAVDTEGLDKARQRARTFGIKIMGQLENFLPGARRDQD